MGSDELIVFQESCYDKLSEAFIEKYRNLWEDFVAEEYKDYVADSIDQAKVEGEDECSS